MHFLIHWRNKTDNSSKNSRLTLEIVSAFSGFKFAKIFESTFVISVDTKDQYDKVYSKVLDAVKADPKVANFVVTPPMPESSYKGWLPKSVWSELNRVSRGESDDSV
ncbi:MAG: hypothetical protein EON89_09935 [Brevundimonas sp.]|nr:MAG: hypothetical protein EON89_09935 [Brevundimonas sp.]